MRRRAGNDDRTDRQTPSKSSLSDDIKLVKKGLKTASRELLAGDRPGATKVSPRKQFCRDSRDHTRPWILPDCHECRSGTRTSHNGSAQCSSGSIANGGSVAHCDCDTCSPVYNPVALEPKIKLLAVLVIRRGGEPIDVSSQIRISLADQLAGFLYQCSLFRRASPVRRAAQHHNGRIYPMSSSFS